MGSNNPVPINLRGPRHKPEQSEERNRTVMFRTVSANFFNSTRTMEVLLRY